ncbi:MAG TPA: hypothetical protein VH054_30415 [Polyangiaceae bacterium]|nr:hypothetical protein [Polyangiaceae bacterium]
MLVLGLAPLLAGCALSFTPEREGQSYPQTVKMASRTEHPGPSSCEIGTIAFTGSMEDRWEDVARTAAENGGTHYYVRTKYTNERLVTHGVAYSWGNVTTGRTSSHLEHDEQNVVLVYTCDTPDD